jgi:hypothetical protein
VGRAGARPRRPAAPRRARGAARELPPRPRLLARPRRRRGRGGAQPRPLPRRPGGPAGGGGAVAPALLVRRLRQLRPARGRGGPGRIPSRRRACHLRGRDGRHRPPRPRRRPLRPARPGGARAAARRPGLRGSGRGRAATHALAAARGRRGPLPPDALRHRGGCRPRRRGGGGRQRAGRRHADPLPDRRLRPAAAPAARGPDPVRRVREPPRLPAPWGPPCPDPPPGGGAPAARLLPRGGGHGPAGLAWRTAGGAQAPQRRPTDPHPESPTQ